MRPPLIIQILSLAFVMALGLTARADDGFSLPADPAQWINSGPISMESLKGKSAFLWFYEEGCPNCRRKWPDLVQLSQQYQGQPIVFIAVNSGNPRQAVEQYIRGVDVPWPVIVDPLREFEKACGVNEISLENIHQVMVIDPNGRLASGDWSDLPATVDSALNGAKWNLDPKEIAQPLLPAWQSIEFGDYASAATALKKALKSSKPDVKASATKLSDYVNADMQKRLEPAAGVDDAWLKYKTYKEVNERFAGYELPEEVTSGLKRLAVDPAVKGQIAAYRQFIQIKNSLQSNNPTIRNGALARLKTFAEANAETDAGKEAEALRQQIRN
ncbi:TlpA family protein disulfide reductase [Planctomicrobium piriforme]|uniref:Peroxiredoxin n=1 Tax=Planctomicrobium piriforme TaxID=1576369 RepID=A0A1I3QUA5_9PLAN|nr:TlpA disulfide reductase family protein [Planctomicrobium piriforme]SFJ37042.1 Peroxiredoxin [Planctomicrobium piriforme]